MCGRYTLVSKLKIIEEEFNADTSGILDRFEVNPNIAPGDLAVVITGELPRRCQLFRFGFTPHWAQKPMYVINARSEGDHNKENNPLYVGARGIISKPMFRKSIRSQRCLVLADAFVEGSTKNKLSEPYLVYNEGKKCPFAMAGIWDEWFDKSTGELVRSFAIITTAPTPLMMELPHHRSPLVLEKHQEELWLDHSLPLSEITELMKPFQDGEFNAYPISTDIKSGRNKDLDVLQPHGMPIRKKYKVEFFQDLKLEGMGKTTARQRREDDPFRLF